MSQCPVEKKYLELRYLDKKGIIPGFMVEPIFSCPRKRQKRINKEAVIIKLVDCSHNHQNELGKVYPSNKIYI